MQSNGSLREEMASSVHELRGTRKRASTWARVFAWMVIAAAGASSSARAQSNAVVAQMELGAPASTSFVLHGTLPIPPGVYPRADMKLPFALVNPDGSIVDTQIEQVSAYPKASDGADVIELIGRVKLPLNTAPGTRVVYKVVNHLHTRTPRAVTPVAESLLLHPATVMIVAKDCFGNTYGTDLSPGSVPAPSIAIETLKSGVAATQVRTYGTMLPLPNTVLGAPTGALQHLFGVHAYFTALQGEDVVSLDLRVNNGASGLDPTTPIDNPLGKVYFKSLELWVKSGWNVLQQGSDPMFGGSLSQGNWTAYELVEPNPDGTLHFMPAQGQFVRRLALCKIGQETKARALLNDEGQAFCKRGFSPTGMELYSWWNPLTARYFPQRHRLPELDYIGATNIRAKLAGQLAILETAITSGQVAIGFGMIGTANLGWAHPWGVKYGGMTGGGEINIFDGVLTAESASNEGYRIAQLTHRAYNDRQPDALYNKDGRPTELLQWVQQGPSGPYVNMKFYGKLLAGPDPFGFNLAQTYQATWVSGNNKKPAYEATLAAFMPIDLQHNIRITRSMKVLAWLGNDSMAKDDLRMRAEIFRLSWHNFANNANNVPQAGGLLDNYRKVSQTPGAGFKVGRGEGWGIDTVNAAFSLGEPSYRASLMPWYAMMATTFSLGQAPCNGYVQSQVSTKQLNGMYYQRQQYEASIIENGLRGAVESALRGADPASASALEIVLKEQIEAMISPMAWDPVQRGPWKNLAMAPLTAPNTTYCNFVPPGGTSPGVEKFQNWCSYAYGYAINHNQNLLNYAKTQMGGDLLLCFKSQKYKDLDNRAALIALVLRP